MTITTTTTIFNNHNYSHLLVASAWESFWPKPFKNNLARPDDQLKVAGIYNLFRMPAITRLLFMKDIVRSSLSTNN